LSRGTLAHAASSGWSVEKQAQAPRGFADIC
jgi:hypothetical protein